MSDSIVIPKSAQRWPVEPEPKSEGKKTGETKLKQSKAYNSAKTLNDREQRRLALTLDVFKKDLRTANHLVSLEQKQVRRELQSINPDVQVDPARGFFVPRGVTQEQAELLRDSRRASVPAPTRSISLAEFDEMRQRRSRRSREVFESSRAAVLQGAGDGEELTDDALLERARRRGRRGAVPVPDKPAAFTSMARVATNAYAGGGGGGGGNQTTSPRQAASSVRKPNKTK